MAARIGHWLAVVGLVGCATARGSERVEVENRAPVVRPAPVAANAIEGRVIDTATGQVLAGVTVVASGSVAQTAITEDDGTYVMTGLAPGEYLVTFFFGELTIERRVIVGERRGVRVDQRIDTAAPAAPVPIVIW